MTNLCARCGHDGDDPNTHYWGPPEVASPCRVSGCNCEDFLSMNETERNTQVSPKPKFDPQQLLGGLMGDLGDLKKMGLQRALEADERIKIVELRVARLETNIKTLMRHTRPLPEDEEGLAYRQ